MTLFIALRNSCVVPAIMYLDKSLMSIVDVWS